MLKNFSSNFMQKELSINSFANFNLYGLIHRSFGIMSQKIKKQNNGRHCNSVIRSNSRLQLLTSILNKEARYQNN